MAGFLDSNSQVIDMVLTDYGKELYSQGNLRFVYYSFSDDEVDYDPYIYNSSSFSDTELSASKLRHIEYTLVREATTGHEKGMDRFGLDRTNITNKLYTIPQGQKHVPSFKIDPGISSGTLEVKQRKIQEKFIRKNQKGSTIEQTGPYDRGYEKFQPSTIRLDPDIEGFADASEGYIMRVFLSGTDGYKEIIPKRDFDNEISFMHDLIVKVDGDVDSSNPTPISRRRK